MTEADRSAKLRAIAAHFGLKRQLLQTMEENAELTKECSKSIRKEEISEGLIEEIADVTMMIRQVMWLLAIRDEDIEKMIDYKIKRTLKRIEEGEE